MAGQINESFHHLFQAQARTLYRTDAEAWPKPKPLAAESLPTNPKPLVPLNGRGRHAKNAGSGRHAKSAGSGRHAKSAGSRWAEERRDARAPGNMYELGKTLPTLQRAREAVLASVDWGHVQAVLGSTAT